MGIVFKDVEFDSSILVRTSYTKNEIVLEVDFGDFKRHIFLDEKTAIAFSKELRKSIAEIKNKSNG